MSNLTLFGLFTFSHAQSVQTELDEFLSGEDALVVEYSETATFRELLVAALKFPVLMISTRLAVLLLSAPLDLVLTRSVERVDREAFQRIAGERPVHFVDDHSVTSVGESERLWLVGNWTLLLGAVVWNWQTVLLLAGLSLFAVIHAQLGSRLGYPRLALLALCIGFGTALWLLVAGHLNGLLLGAFLVSSGILLELAGRGEADRLLDDVSALLGQEEYDEVCLVTEKSTVTELLDAVDDTGLTVSGAFLQRWRKPGCHVDAAGEPVDTATRAADAENEPLLRHVGDTLEDRIEARLLDWCVLAGLLLVIGAAELGVVLFLKVPLGFDIDFGAPVIAGSGVDIGHLWLVSLLVPLMAYYTVSEGLWGRTFGKHRVGLRVRHTDGSTVGMRSAALRTLAGWVDFLPVAFVIGGLLASGQRHGRRIADLAAGTVVVEESVAREHATEPAEIQPDTPSEADRGRERDEVVSSDEHEPSARAAETSWPAPPSDGDTEPPAAADGDAGNDTAVGEDRADVNDAERDDSTEQSDS